MFATPRPKKGLLTQAPPSKKRKAAHTVEEISFDNSKRQEYLTGFHKRKLERARKAQESAAEKERHDRIALRKQMREDRQHQVEDHVKNVERLLKEHRMAGQEQDGNSDDSGSEGQDAWDGFDDIPAVPQDAAADIDYEEEYIDEDKHSTVKVEAVSIDRDGFHGPGDSEDEDEEDREEAEKKRARAAEQEAQNSKKRAYGPKKKKPKFRYESKDERKAANLKIRAHKARFRSS